MELRIESYIQLQDYALWEIIEDGNSFMPVARTTTNADGTSTSTIPGAVTAEEKIQKKNDLKARSILMMTLPSEHLLNFNQYKDAKTLLNDATIYAFLANQPNGSQVVHEDLEQIHKDDLEEMDLKWQLALLSMKARKFHPITRKKIIINGSDTAGYDKIKVECFNCHKMGHFARECRNPRSQEYRSKNQDSLRKTVDMEESSSKAMLAIDGVGFDWSFMTEEKTPTNFALMTFSDSVVICTPILICKLRLEELKTLDLKDMELREVRPVWNNAMRTNHPQNFSNSRRNFALTTVLTKSGLVPISTARQSSSRAATSVSTVKPIKTAAPKFFVNDAKTRPNNFQKLHSPSRRPFYQQTSLKNRNLNNKVNIVKVNSVNIAKGKRVTSAVGE
ncbi:ribonuclease H-like domain-containing protein, partial [Tanacetum coccineum]